MFKRLGNTSISFIRWAGVNFLIKPFSLQRETRAEATRSDRRRYLFYSSRLWQSTLPYGCVPMKRLMVVSLACLLSACVSNAANLSQTHTDKMEEFPAMATDLSACVHQATEALDVPYAFRLHARPDKRKISITATSVSKVITRREMIGLELHFIPQGQSTTVEMRKGVTGGWWLAPKVWPLIERCSQHVTAPPAASLPAP